MEGSPGGDGYVRNFKTQAQIEQAAPIAAQEYASRTLSAVWCQVGKTTFGHKIHSILLGHVAGSRGPGTVK